ncbi:MAG: hypothetical protein LBV44_03220 [Methylobacillus sp.]|jgi:hypothetical protein|nr:hypothetical protein [Methylobacillus sp.]
MPFITAQLNAKLQPLHRGDLFEDPLDAFLQEHGLGQTSGGGTLLENDGEVAYCDVEIEVESLSEQTLQRVIGELERLGAPQGSWLKFGGERADIPLGKLEGLGVYLNGTDLPPEVYRECDSNVVYSELEKRIEGMGSIFSWWDGATETALYLYGDSFAAMRDRIADFLADYPLCQRCRVVQIA